MKYKTDIEKLISIIKGASLGTAADYTALRSSLNTQFSLIETRLANLDYTDLVGGSQYEEKSRDIGKAKHSSNLETMSVWDTNTKDVVNWTMKSLVANFLELSGGIEPSGSIPAPLVQCNANPLVSGFPPLFP